MTKPNLKFLLTSEKDQWFSGSEPTLRVKLSAVYLDEERRIRNPSYDGLSDSIYGELDSFEISTLYGKTFDWYGWTAEFRQPYKVDMERAESMLKVLRKMTRKLAAEERAFGAAPDFPTYAARVAQAVGAKLDGETFGLGHPRGEAMWATGDRYRWTDVDGLRYRLNDLAKELQPAS